MVVKLPESDYEKQQILQKIARKFEKEKEYSEKEVDEIIYTFNVEDVFLFRRALVKFKYLEHEPYSGNYKLLRSMLSRDELFDMEINSKKFTKVDIDED